MRLASTFALLAAAFLLAACGGATVATVERPDGRAAPEMIHPQSAVESGADMKIGSFEKPEEVPEYEAIERREIRRDGVRATRLLIDTKAESEAGYELIARDLKAEFASYDAVSAEVTDTSSGFDYNGAILIFNTPEGSYYMGFLYSPPSNLGYIVDVAG
ncbi:MAG: hypothetical protein ACR2N0_01285 [Rubrobacteraceae bacterium]|jgi:hypothetical protein